MVRVLLRHGAAINQASERGMTALMCAAQTGQTKVVQCLLDAKANVTAKTRSGETALHIARKKRFTKIVGQLIASGARE